MIGGPIGALIGVIGICLAVAVAVLIVMFVLVPIFKGVAFLFAQAGRFLIGEIGDVFRVVGAVITNVVFIPLVVGSVVLGRWSAAAHFGRAIQSEFKTMGLCVYRIAIGHPARLLCLTALTDGIEHRLPEVVAAAPGPDRPAKGRSGQFDGYTIVGSLPGGGSGSRLFIAEPDELKLASFTRNGQHDVGKVVIKLFSLRDGSSLPQIVREGRALDAAKKLGLVLEHELTDDRFFYITRYVPGESMGLVTQRLHAQSGSEGLAGGPLQAAMGYTADLLRTLDTYHRGGLWHKDVKPDNIIVDGRAAHLVDFGLVTPLRSAMTLTTHGTEYFRDPEMVRMALKGVKVHQVDGAKFDLYATGAVLFSMIENSFPAHGGLSQVSKKCPEALRWIVRRAMAEYDRRYASAAMMLADLETVRVAHDPFAVRPADLPSMKQGDAPIVETLPHDPLVAVGVTPAAAAMPPAAAAFAGTTPPPNAGPRPRVRPSIRLAHWWSGRYESDRAPDASPAPAATPAGGASFAGVHAGIGPDGAFFDVGRGAGSPVPPRAARVARGNRASASAQLDSARARVTAARERARQRMAGRRPGARTPYDPGVNAGVATALFTFLAAAVAIGGFVMVRGMNSRGPRLAIEGPSARIEVPAAPEAPAAPLVEEASDRSGRFRTELRSSAASRLGEEPGRVLVISDVGVLAPERTLLAISGACDRLVGEGFELLGNFPGNDAAGDERKVQEGLEVAARSAVGLLPLDSKEAAPTLETWLRADDEVDMIVWFKPDKGAPSGVAAHVFADLFDQAETRGFEQSQDRKDVARRAMR